MLILRGAPALSDFRLQKLTRHLAQKLGASVAIAAEYVHFADVDQALDVEEMAVLERLLRYGPALPAGQADGTPLLDIKPAMTGE